MGTKSTAVKRCRRYRIRHFNGRVSRVLEIVWVDPGRPGKLLVERLEQVQPTLEFIPVNVALTNRA
jgi:rRNA maturation protein Rpf1